MLSINPALIEIDQQTWERFNTKATKDGKNTTTLLTTLIHAYLNNQIDLERELNSGDAEAETRLREVLAEMDNRIKALDEGLAKWKQYERLLYATQRGSDCPSWLTPAHPSTSTAHPKLNGAISAGVSPYGISSECHPL